MELNNSSSDTDDYNVKSSSEDSSNAKYIKLEKEVEDLKNILKQLQNKLNTVKSDNVKRSLTESNIHNVSDTSDQAAPTDIKLELYRYNGLYCMNANNKELIVGFNSSMKKQQENQFAVQFLKKKRNLKIGKWVMPMSTDMEQLQSEVQLNAMQHVLRFTRNCKQHIDCYTSRLQQFQELKSIVENLRNCNVQSNLGYTLVILELLHVHDKKNDTYVNITIYLWYNSKNGRPSEINFEISGRRKYDKVTGKELKKSLKVFRSNDLQTAFDDILNKDNAYFTWNRTSLEINESDSSKKDELSPYEEMPQKKISRKRLKKKLKKIGVKKKKKDNSSNDLYPQNANVEKNKRTSSQTPLKKQSKVLKSKSTHKLPLDNLTDKLRLLKERKMNSKIIQDRLNMKPFSIILRPIDKYTSTPIRSNPQSTTPFKVLPSYDISTIIADGSLE